MYFVYIDEAGTPGFKDPKKIEGYFTLACLIVNGENLLPLENSLSSIKQRFDIHPDEEFKWGSKYSKVGWDYKIFCEFRESMFDLIHTYSEVVVATVMDKKESFKKGYINNHYELYQNALYYCMERIHMWCNDNGISGPLVFVIDSRKNNKQSDLDDNLFKAFKRALNTGTYFFNGFPYFSETAFFSISESSAGLQLADYCAGSIYHYLTTGKDEWYLKLRGKIRKDPSGIVNGFGIKHFPNRPKIQY